MAIVDSLSSKEKAGGTPYFDNLGSRIGIFVIAYNAEAHIRKTLTRIPQDVMEAIETIYVVDDCSHDETVDEAMRCSQELEKVRVLRNRVNQRYGGNQKVGYQYAIDQNLDVVVMLHADGQYAPEYLAKILAPLVEKRADVVMGSRMIERGRALEGGMPRYKYVGNQVLTRIQNQMTGMNLSEFHSGYRAYSVELLRGIPFWTNSDEWHFDTQILLQANQHGARIEEIPMPTYYGDEICHVNGMLYGWNCIRTSVLYWLHCRGIFYSRRFDISRGGEKYTEKFSDPHSSHSQITAYLSSHDLEGRRVLDLGVGDAAIVKWLHARGCSVDAVELDAASAHLAEPFCRRVIVDDLDKIQHLDLETDYDYVIAADVLEHVRSPEVVLSYLKRALKRKGVLIVSLPNVANLYVRLNLLVGRFPYHTKGILDCTHLHFYTRGTARTMLERSGWNVKQERVTPIPFAIVFAFLRKRFGWLLCIVYGATRLFSGLLAYQTIFFCENPNKSDLL